MVNKIQVQVVIWTSAAAALLAAVWIASPQWLLNAATSTLRQQPPPHCRCFPGDACWPSPAEWAAFNSTLGGRLIATVPLASPCHDDDFGGASSYDADRCAAIQSAWANPELHDGTAHSAMRYLFGNASCDPFAPREAPCALDAYVPYAVNASDASHYAATLAFARRHDIRLVIRNTGHDYNGKSTGAGALALWTRNLKDRVVFDYPPDRPGSGSGLDFEGGAGTEDGAAYVYTGKTMKVGAGVQAGEAQAAANALGYVVVEGDCPTVGYAGGYTQGGGTSPLASKFGLAADQVLEWEVVTADGELLTATPSQNSDLYWALTGGGGGTYGVVLSMTVKMHKNMPTAGAVLLFASDDYDAFWSVAKAFLTNLPAVLDAGATAIWVVLPGQFRMSQCYFPDGTAQELERLYQPTLEALKQSGIHYGKHLHRTAGWRS
ncbi:hypothetical protein SLS62_007264 [Diatrype stigma]|uniref:FAD-binding PCMH-type domain-containing protein n=1 Tax=Diatrype stigma TaxID=117547 RepID=A0AAN9URA3_9PEZI